MQKKLIIVILITLLLFSVLAALFIFRKEKTTADTADTASESVMDNDPGQSLREFLNSGGSKRCVYEKDDISSVIYVANGKMRTDMTETNPQGSASSHIIYSDNTAYYWMEGQDQGYTMALDINELTDEVNKFQDNGSGEAIDFEENIRERCSDWNADMGLFTIPDNIEFSDFSAFLENLKSSGQPAADCSVCASMPDEAKEACLTAYNCE